jgi:hypothetical protein
MMQTLSNQFPKPADAPAKGAKVHVALLDADGVAIIHEELPVAAAPHRHYMLCLQAELDARDLKVDRGVYMGETWPPPSPAVTL